VRKLFWTAALTLLFSAYSFIPVFAVYNGSPANGNERVVLITGSAQGKIGCTGSLVAPRIIYTAAHCAEGGASYVWPQNATVGMSNSINPIKVVKRFIPKEFSVCSNCGRGAIEDFMVLVLEKDLAEVEPLRIATVKEVAGLIANQTDVIQIGYGVKQLAPNNNGAYITANYPDRIVSKLRATSFLQNNQEEKDLLLRKPNVFINTVNSPDKTMCGGDSGGPLYFMDGTDYVYIGALSSVTGIECRYTKDDPMRTNAFWIERTLGVYYVAAYYQSTINEAELFVKSEVENEKVAADLKAKQEVEAKAAAPKKTTITCTKGKLVKKVMAVKPVCPKGFKKK
jgi:secreted trypsin-like serine protease